MNKCFIIFTFIVTLLLLSSCKDSSNFSESEFSKRNYDKVTFTNYANNKQIYIKDSIIISRFVEHIIKADKSNASEIGIDPPTGQLTFLVKNQAIYSFEFFEGSLIIDNIYINTSFMVNRDEILIETSN